MNVIFIMIDTLRRDHLSCYGTEKASQYFKKQIKTPHFDQFASRGTIFEQAYLGSFPCMPVRRDFWTGRYEFPWRGWGPLEDDDLDMFNLLRSHHYINMLISDHYHILERDAGNYHFGFNGWDMIRGQEHDPYLTEPLNNGIKESLDHTRSGAWYLHQKNLRGNQRYEEELYAPQVFRRAASWLETNATEKLKKDRPFCLMVECFDPHEPWDPPLHRVEELYPNGLKEKMPHSPVYGSANRFNEEELLQMRTLYTAELTLVDHWFGYFMDKVSQLNLWDDTVVVVTTDHGFFLGEHGLVGKPDLVPLYSDMSHIPLMIYHPEGKPNSRSSELVQLIDIFPTIIDSLNIDLPRNVNSQKPIAGSGHKKAWEGISERSLQLHGKSLLPILKGKSISTRQAVFSGKFGDMIRVSDGKWSLYLPPIEDNELYWYGVREPGRTFIGRRGEFEQENQRYTMEYRIPSYKKELYHVELDPTEGNNLSDHHHAEIERLEQLFILWLDEIDAPNEMKKRYGVLR
ncbi:sulfatase-like hydrolase/transferase [Metabacillus halosaccharovorans]|uniref:Sulfatase-like hydrolase/transferase n=1 Tax=Metabacillus halosaccharovorans TaxID=930124 RepID=A0ABT3DQP8_9BACI|nr:sulfatase-like hydrolase/transferase [Metabacillus halosaccharovorans]MCV9888957.1 sulfatase-like hydrolase/transferase [Metabacillus halosaccharovorans]